MSLKPGIHKNPKIKSIVSVFSSAILFIFIVLQSGCDRAIVYPGELTQTARANTPLPESTGVPLQSTVPPINPDAPVDLPTNFPTLIIPSTPIATANAAQLDATKNPPILYYSQSGDTRVALGNRFEVQADEITSPNPLPPKESLIQPNQLLIIPNKGFSTAPVDRALPDSELILSPSAKDFSTAEYARQAGGYLSTYQEWIDHWYTGPEIITRVALENSISPRIFLALLEYQSHWVFGKPTNLAMVDYPMGWKVLKNRGLYLQLTWAARMLSTGYYGWRTGELTSITYMDGKTRERLAPQINAGTVALQYLYSKLDDPQQLGGDIYSPNGLPALYKKMFGDPWARSQSIEPLFPPNLTQPFLELPFLPGHTWALTGGPHYAWFPDAGSLAALDLAPPADAPGCQIPDEKVTSVGPGVVTRSDRGVVAVDMDGDGYEETGWTIFYLHIADIDRVKVGDKLNTNDPIGHPSCQGGDATGVHVHIARKFNGEWMAADGPVPFVMSGYRALNGPAPYLGNMIKGTQTVVANTNIEAAALITRPKFDDPDMTPAPDFKGTPTPSKP